MFQSLHLSTRSNYRMVSPLIYERRCLATKTKLKSHSKPKTKKLKDTAKHVKTNRKHEIENRGEIGKPTKKNQNTIQDSNVKSKTKKNKHDDNETVDVNLQITEGLRMFVDEKPLETQQNIALMVLDAQSHILKSNIKSAAARATFVHAHIDAAIANELKQSKLNKSFRPISCQKGCNWCCQQMVFVTSDETQLLFKKLQEQHGPKLNPQIITYIKEQAQFGSNNIDEFWQLPTHKSACVFLTDGICSIYKERPSACRNFQVSSVPKLCAKGATEMIDREISVAGEVLASAALSLPKQTYMPMQQQLLVEIRKRKLVEE